MAGSGPGRPGTAFLTTYTPSLLCGKAVPGDMSMQSVDTRTYLESEDSRQAEFAVLKTKAGKNWHYVLTSEWSTMSGAYGRPVFLFARSPCLQWCAIKCIGFPTRVVGAAKASPDAALEDVLGRLLRAVSDAGGPRTEMVYDCADFVDLGVFWDAYAPEQ
jgi:hypothetical protein